MKSSKPAPAAPMPGYFTGQHRRVVAPVELKGGDTQNLDAIMPGRHKSPVQQAWEYANDTRDCQWVLLSNMLEIRLYAVSHTRQVYERWDILDLADSDAEYQLPADPRRRQSARRAHRPTAQRTAPAPTRRLPRRFIATTGNGGKR